MLHYTDTSSVPHDITGIYYVDPSGSVHELTEFSLSAVLVYVLNTYSSAWVDTSPWEDSSPWIDS